jgi:hypothetical protein
VLRDQLNELRSFNRRHYLRIWDLKLVADLESLCAEAGQLKDDWIVISDYSPGISLSELVRERVESGKLLSSEQRISDQTISIARQLAAALWEGEYHNLQLMRFTPEEIYIEHNEQDGTPLVRFAPLSITGLVEYVARAVKWTDEAGPYTAPELWNEKLPVFTADGAKRGKLSAKIDRANQFTFGMILWFMLRGDLDFKSYPDEASHATIVRFEQRVRGLSAAVTSCSARGLKRRALCRIVERLVRFNPNERWESMKDVKLLLGAFSIDSDRADLFSIVKEVYKRVCVSRDGSLNDIFYKGFYNNLFRSSKKLKRLFTGIDMHRQRTPGAGAAT